MFDSTFLAIRLYSIAERQRALAQATKTVTTRHEVGPELLPKRVIRRKCMCIPPLVFSA